MRPIVRRAGHPGAQLQITHIDDLHVTAFVTNRTKGQLAELELRHREQARAEDRILWAKDTRLAILPLHDFTQAPDLVRHRAGGVQSTRTIAMQLGFRANTTSRAFTGRRVAAPKVSSLNVALTSGGTLARLLTSTGVPMPDTSQRDRSDRQHG
ncbi:hypothetical protein [Modestobacter excelsi]|uniref:hypothetical protein n=1 Tax=Modestobacter excelsi TaxID=2213161 RepID=UPI00110CA153|nr:hypothetical protein [Modestobacter excelsi]